MCIHCILPPHTYLAFEMRDAFYMKGFVKYMKSRQRTSVYSYLCSVDNRKIECMFHEKTIVSIFCLFITLKGIPIRFVWFNRLLSPGTLLYVLLCTLKHAVITYEKVLNSFRCLFVGILRVRFNLFTKLY